MNGFFGKPHRLTDKPRAVDNEANERARAQKDSMARQMQQYRERMKRKCRAAGPRTITLDDIRRKQRNGRSFQRAADLERIPKPRSASDLLRPDVVAAKALEYTNAFRRQHGKPPLEHDPALIRAGQSHADDMARAARISHDRFSGRAQAIGAAAGENVAMVGNSGDAARAAVDAWIGSPGHRANLLGAWTRMGVSVCARGGMLYLCQLFAVETD
ncbi:Cysteine-rich secretory protein family [Carpediemonas membranifera]|uniref:Cysteine-rich secretory protein family n=1 Tax=Carpediemonas membranifera TaxID=201153 RepID=A0A8J6E2T8_9EUKA|nr:Cysteine-rich secretory protein family [Carpediemonas membranifera]|eukprot:KAG9395078.1 Cysteine-rich secretory protein family [Carpediemonas membranifera]